MRWQWRPESGLVSDPVLAGDVLIVCDAGHRIHALDLASGRPRWSWHASGPIAAPVAVADDRVYVGGPQSAVTALDLASGAACWQVDHRGDWYEREHPSSTSPPAIFGDLLVYRTAWGMHGVDRHTGASRWWTRLFSEAAGSDSASRS
ncbi:outer membrane protein assembly factor BamB family protein, partial [Streptomyces sp. NPDC002285]